MDPTLEQRLRDADPLVRRTPDETRDQDWLRESALSVTTQPPRSRRPRALVLVAVAAAMVLAATAGGFLLRGGDDGAGKGHGVTAAAPTVTDLTVGAEDTMAMCIRFSVETLSPMPVAFSGVVSAKSADEILIDVDTLYRGGETDQVRLSAPDMSMTSLGSSIDFQEGSRYLVTATDGTVNYCGFSGPWTQDLADTFAAAFGPGQ
jgi:hypothetical protein